MPKIPKTKQKNKQKQYQPISLVNQSTKIQINNKQCIDINRWVYICIIIGLCIGIVINVYMIIQNNGNMSQGLQEMFGNNKKIDKQYTMTNHNVGNTDSINTMTVIQQIIQQNILNNKIQHINPNIPTTNNDQQHKQYHKQITNQQQSEIQHQPILQLTPNSQIQKQQLIRQRIKLGQPKLAQRQLAYILIQGNPRSHICTLINTVNILTQTSVKTGIYLLQNLHINTLLYIIDNNDQFVDELVNKQFTIYKIKRYQFQIDSDYRFIRVIAGYRQCQKIMYLSNNFNIVKKNSKILEDIIGRDYNLNVYYTPTALSNKIQQKLAELNNINLQKLPPAYFNKYLYVFDSRYIGLINPVNFAYYAKYTIQELIVIPILVLAQKLGKIQPFVGNASVHQYDRAIVQYKYFQLKQKKSQASNNTKGNTPICFVSYTSNPYEQQYIQLIKYLKSLSQLNLTNTKTSIIIFLPYKPQNINTTMFTSIINYTQKLKKLNNIQRVKLIIKPNKTTSSLSVYQSLYTYCTDQSIIVSSRHNIKYDPNFVQYLIKQTGNKIGVFVTNFINEEKRKVKFQPLSKLKQGSKQSQIQNQLKEMYEKYFYAVQIFHSHLLNNAYFWQLKSKEIDFYQSQASFLHVLLQIVQMQVHAINLTLYTVSKRFHSQTQLLQHKLIRKHKLLPSTKIHAQSYNSLQNIAFKRYTTNKIPKTIHIISLNQNSIKVQQRIKQLKTTNPDFSTKVWNKQNIIPLNFPLSYKYIAKLFSYDSKSKMIQTIVSKIMAYEILYNYGGICISSQIKILRSLQQFLKYQLLLTSIYPTNTNSTETHSYTINQTIIGSTQYNYYLHITLTEIITHWQSLQLNDNNIILMNNNSLISKALNDEQFYTNVGFGFHLFYMDSKEEQQLQKLLCAKNNIQVNQNRIDKACSGQFIPYAVVQEY